MGAGEREGEAPLLPERDDAGEREGASDGVAPGVRVPPITLGSNAVGNAGIVGPLAVGVGATDALTAKTVRDQEGEVEGKAVRVDEALPRGEDDTDGDLVAATLRVAKMEREIERVCVAVARGEAEPEAVRLGEGLPEGVVEEDGQRLPVAVGGGEREAEGQLVTVTDAAAERVAALGLPHVVRVPPHRLGPRS